MSASKITIIGGHGKVALLASKLLSSSGYTVHSLVRNPEQVSDVEQTGAKAVIFDLEKSSEDHFAKQLAGSHTVIWSAGAGGKGGPERTNAVDREAAIKAIKAAKSVGVRHFVTVSFLYADQRPFKNSDSGMKPYGDAKADADEFLRHSGLNWSILGPGRLTLDKGTGKILLNPSKTLLNSSKDALSGGNATSRENVALVILEAIKHPELVKNRVVDFIDGEQPILDALKELNPESAVQP